MKRWPGLEGGRDGDAPGAGQDRSHGLLSSSRIIASMDQNTSKGSGGGVKAAT
jgi:predicted outer membrane repeat protein